MSTKCPGSNVEITLAYCPGCGAEVELFSGESKAKCTNCGQLVQREKASCIEWCPGAKTCFSHVYKKEDDGSKKS